jgi:hypothetical protein
MRVAAVLFVTLLAGAATAGIATGIGCSSSSGNGAGPGDGGGDECAPIDSACGQPCDPGNSLGIGRFCNFISDCEGTAIPTICATLGDKTEHFCTALCVPPDADNEAGFPTDCGANATCQCQGQCGCFPNSCN